MNKDVLRPKHIVGPQKFLSLKAYSLLRYQIDFMAPVKFIAAN